ncbi:AAA family ATPase [Arcobacter defluvii]|uniref:ATP-binding protein (AAA domain) n=1 Tax=Arcobacter defluvii TaxID=873191 RepID=A0AAE7E7G3_9BACT|nr:AAA family ATPase [Arcobacter defluvii]QKF78036.1 ATP-binding protein (AAA domain) [Arcobacter defluvii]RXI29980.1 hypothetical protein CP964_12605 [Arcobacter defluvii]
MELVYLWVEEYKNIENQGFRFSPRFEFHYDKDSKKLTKVRDESTTYKSIFPDNINITAIVGENGTGKSSLLKLIHKNLLIWKGSGFAIFKDKNDEILYSGEVEDYPILEDYKKLCSNNKKIDFPFFEYSFTYDRDIDYNNEFIYPKKQINSIKGGIHLINELFRNQKNILLNYFDLKETKQLDKFESFFIPKTINIFFDIETVKQNDKYPSLTKESKSNLAKLKSLIYPNLATTDFINEVKEISKLLTNRNSYEERTNEFDYFNPEFEFQLGKYDTQEEEYNNLWKNSQKSFIELNNLSETKVIKLVNSNEKWLNESNLLIYSFDIEKLDSKIIEIIMASFSSYQFTIQLCDNNNKALNDLSFGEQQLLFILNQLYSLKNKVDENKSLENNIVLLDEIDIGLHPMWQKKSINYICEFLKLLPNINFHLIFATHSPFILSDIPKENVIFLEKYKENDEEVKNENQKVGNCKNVSKDIELNTFGANIHTLLSNGFFMSEGLMGEFAQNKINNVIKKLKDKNYNPSKNEKENILAIIKIIGEDFLRTKLLDMYYKKFDDDFIKKQRKEELLEQQEKIKKELENL